jgi:hypothetical protein
MKQKIKIIFQIWALGMALFNFVLILNPAPARAAVNSLLSGQICTPDNSNEGQSTNLARCVNNIYAFAVAIGGFVAVLMFVVAGYYYALGGNENVTTAKGYINSTVVGLILLFGTYALLNTIDPNLTTLPKLTAPGADCTIKFDPITKQSYDPCANPDKNPYVDPSIKDQTITNADKTATPSPLEGGNVTNSLTPSGRFNQTANPWGRRVYADRNGNPCGTEAQSTIGTSGCGPSALAMALRHFQVEGRIKLDPIGAPQVAKVAAAYGDSIDPGIIADISSKLGYRVCGSGTSYQMFVTVSKYYGVSAISDVSWDQAYKALKANKDVLVIAAMGPGYFTGGGHFVLLYGVSGDKILVSDSGPRNRTIASAATVDADQHFLVILTPNK